MNLPLRCTTFAMLASICSMAGAVELSQPTRIEGISIRDDLGVVRVEVLISAPPSNPAGCLNDTFIDFRLDAPDRSPTQQRELLNLLNVAFVTRRSVRFFLLDAADDDPCSSVGTSSTIRVAVGLQANF